MIEPLLKPRAEAIHNIRVLPCDVLKAHQSRLRDAEPIILRCYASLALSLSGMTSQCNIISWKIDSRAPDAWALDHTWDICPTRQIHQTCFRPPPSRPAPGCLPSSAMRRKYAHTALPNLWFKDGVLSVPGYTFEKVSHSVLSQSVLTSIARRFHGRTQGA